MTPSQDAFCDKCGYIGPSQPYGQHNRPKDGQPCNYMACATPDAHLRSTSPARAATWEAACDEIFGSPAGEVGEMASWLRAMAVPYLGGPEDAVAQKFHEAAAMLKRLAASDTEARAQVRDLTAQIRHLKARIAELESRP